MSGSGSKFEKGESALVRLSLPVCVICLCTRVGAHLQQQNCLGHKPACRSPVAEHPCAANDAVLCAQFNPDNTPAKTRAPSGFRCARLHSTPLPGRSRFSLLHKGQSQEPPLAKGNVPACMPHFLHACAHRCWYPTLPYPNLKEYTRMHACRACTSCMHAPSGADHSVLCTPACAACSCATTSPRQRRLRRWASLTRQSCAPSQSSGTGTRPRCRETPPAPPQGNARTWGMVRVMDWAGEVSSEKNMVVHKGECGGVYLVFFWYFSTNTL